jgi:AAA domain
MLTSMNRALQDINDARKSAARVATIDYGFKDEDRLPLHNSFDLCRFIVRVDELFNWYTGRVCDVFVAPYFPLIQSSGTGKTRLLYEYSKFVKERNTNDPTKNPTTCLLLTSIHGRLNVAKLVNMEDVSSPALCYSRMTKLVSDCKTTRVVLLIDEAQHLLDDEAITFRRIRWWLRIKREDKQIVTVFTGTNSSLSNFYRDKTKPPKNLGTSRELEEKDVQYHNADAKNDLSLYPPFFDLTTMGSVVVGKNNGTFEYTEGRTDYEKAAMYGRPLFAILRAKDDLTDQRKIAILKRMLIGYDDKKNNSFSFAENETAVLNILGTRVQLGHVALPLASLLVSRGYAHLVDVRNYSTDPQNKHDTASICYFPDPVCAHNAMRLMDKDWTSEDEKIRGQKPEFWTSAAIKFFSAGVCVPSRGDVGEVGAALYLLFCGDILRKARDPNYLTFAVNLYEYIGKLIDPTKTVSMNSQVNAVSANCLINFIQVTRVYHNIRLEELCSVEHLEWMYNSSCAIYTPPYFESLDIIAPIRIIGNGNSNDEYAPFAVSVKTRRIFEKSEIKQMIFKMKKCMKEAKVKKALCVLILLDWVLPKNEMDANLQLSTNDLERFAREPECLMLKVLVVKENDPFGVTDFVSSTRFGSAVESEVYASHQNIHSGLIKKLLTRSKMTVADKKKLNDYYEKMTGKIDSAQSNTSEDNDTVMLLLLNDQIRSVNLESSLVSKPN